MGLTNAYRNWLAKATISSTQTLFNNANCYLGVGNSSAAYAAAQTDLQGASKFRKSMEAGYPQNSSNRNTFKASYGATQANFAWLEWGVFNAGAAGTMANRKPVSSTAFGTKASGTWNLTVTVDVNV